MDELHPLKPQSPYSASKISAETIMRSYYYSFNLPVTILRLFNTYGPRQSIRAVIPNIIIQALSKNNTIFLGDTSPTRDFNYVVDSCNAIINSIKKTKNGEIYNFGSGKEISIKDLVKKICDLTGGNKKIMQKKKFLRPKNSEVFRLVSNSKKFFKITKFKPVYTFDEGIKLSIDWYRKNLSKFKNSQYFN
jgi:dTDP-D-glucose 4,6-dehydratase